MGNSTDINITVDGVEYAPVTEELNDENYVMVRSRDAGVHVGRVIDHGYETGVVELGDSRRIWYWDGAASLSELAVEGTTKPENCKFPVALESHTVLGVCEIIPVTAKALASIRAVPVWTASE